MIWILYVPTKNILQDKNRTFSTQVFSCRFFGSRFCWPFKDFIDSTPKIPVPVYVWFSLVKHRISQEEMHRSNVQLQWEAKKKCTTRVLFISAMSHVKMARYSFLEWIPPKFERKLRRHKQRFGKINTTVVLDKDETLLWSGLQCHRSCHGNEMTPLPILFAAVFLGTRNCSSKIVYSSFNLQ